MSALLKITALIIAAIAALAGPDARAESPSLTQRRAVEAAMLKANLHYQKNFTPGSAVWNRAVYHVGNLRSWQYLGLQRDLDYTVAWSAANIKTTMDALVGLPAATDDWWWIDAFFMAAPTFAKLGVIYNQSSYFSQAEAMYLHMKNPRPCPRRQPRHPLVPTRHRPMAPAQSPPSASAR